MLAELLRQGQELFARLAQLVVGLADRGFEVVHQPVRAAHEAERSLILADVADVEQGLHGRPVVAVHVEIGGLEAGKARRIDLAVTEPGLPLGVHLQRKPEQSQLGARIGAEGRQRPAVPEGRLHIDEQARVLGRLQRDIDVAELHLGQGVEPRSQRLRHRRDVGADAAAGVLIDGVQQDPVPLQSLQHLVAVADADVELALAGALLLDVAALQGGHEGLQRLAAHLLGDLAEIGGERRARLVVRRRQGEHPIVETGAQACTPNLLRTQLNIADRTGRRQLRHCSADALPSGGRLT